MSGEIVQMWIAGHKVGVIDARRIFAEVRDLDLNNADEIGDELLARARKVNYIPSNVEEDYRTALCREFRRFCGEEVDDGRGALEILILGPGCMRCDELVRRVMTVVSRLNLPADVRHARDLNEIAAYGPAPTPALVVNGTLRSTGRVLSEAELEHMLGSEEL